jgi:hypothetical protein
MAELFGASGTAPAYQFATFRATVVSDAGWRVILRHYFQSILRWQSMIFYPELYRMILSGRKEDVTDVDKKQ